ncbi:hypothetical protein CGLAUT_03420 [Corynebacterium glaucum]|uniref:DUF2771 family protein n=1 Tax=Corynebacterium glaucum TaxID=187491 RepID=UPI0025B41D56|nr:DUF2771 family protein [Corynebacterium glaucum]WJZ07186.1 hypothetical protein CGLAUT_03420 [Corynebacterium glaucum]
MADTKRTKRAAGKKTQHWNQIALIATAALVLVAAVYMFMEWQSARPDTPASDLRVEVTSAGETREIEPYTVCELDDECAGDTPPTMALDANEVAFKVPEEVAALSWRLLLIYDDPAANNEVVFTSGEASHYTADAVTESGARLVVGEVSALGVDVNDAGEEIPVIATWSVGFE